MISCLAVLKSALWTRLSWRLWTHSSGSSSSSSTSTNSTSTNSSSRGWGWRGAVSEPCPLEQTGRGVEWRHEAVVQEQSAGHVASRQVGTQRLQILPQAAVTGALGRAISWWSTSGQSFECIVQLIIIILSSVLSRDQSVLPFFYPTINWNNAAIWLFSIQ